MHTFPRIHSAHRPRRIVPWLALLCLVVALGGLSAGTYLGAATPEPSAPTGDDQTTNAQRQQFMRRAIELSREAIETGTGGPFGCVIVRDGQIVGEGFNHVIANNDPTAHGEVTAIRDACHKLGTFNLTGCDLYTSAEPCPMCLSAIYWARIRNIYYGNSVADTKALYFSDDFIYQQLNKPLAARSIPERQLLRDEANRVFQAYGEQQDRVPY